MSSLLPPSTEGTPPASGGAATVTPAFSPLYQQIKGLILHSLQHGEWKPGEAIPSEMELAGRFRVSQGTVRKAIDELAGENLLLRRQGAGPDGDDQQQQAGLERQVSGRCRRFRVGMQDDGIQGRLADGDQAGGPGVDGLAELRRPDRRSVPGRDGLLDLVDRGDGLGLDLQAHRAGGLLSLVHLDLRVDLAGGVDDANTLGVRDELLE